MKGSLISTRDPTGKEVSYSDALLAGLAPDGGLYTPTTYPQLTYDELISMQGLPYPVLAAMVKSKLVDESVPDVVVGGLMERAYSHDKFPVDNGNVTPVREIDKKLFIQNLSLGPTAAFKDMALQPLAQEMEFELMRRNQTLDILAATSGDTGSSAEAAVKGLDGIKLFVLSPLHGMSAFQRAQMGTLTGGNIYNASVRGRFDDCQDLVKALKGEPGFRNLGAVNSINWGRISSQVPYYVSGYLQVADQIGQPVDFVIPSGNFGNVFAGYVARRMGLPIRNLIVATNENNVLAKLIATGIYTATRARVTSSPSMDISKASNYERLAFELLGRDPEKLAAYMKKFETTGAVDLADFGVESNALRLNNFGTGMSTHKNRIETIRRVFERTRGYIDPHTADGVTVAYRIKRDSPMVVMETALPVKFGSTMYEALGFVPRRPERFVGLEARMPENAFHTIPASLDALKAYVGAHI